MSRRTLLTALAAAPLARTVATTGPRTPVVDTHLHVWSGDAARYPFAHPTNRNFIPPALAGTAEVLLEEMDRHAVDFAVLVQVIYYGWDNRYLADVLARHPRRFRAQGLIDPTAPDVAEKLAWLVREHRFSGVRLSPLYYPGREEWMNSEAHHRLWKKAAELGAILNFFLTAPQLPRLEAMLAAHPAVRVVIDHLARVDLAGPNAEKETAQLLALARHRNVWVKISELNLLSPSKRAPYADTWPLLRRVCEAFGPDRLLWGTGFPGATRAQAGRPPLADELALIREGIPFLRATEREGILGGNAARLWGF